MFRSRISPALNRTKTMEEVEVVTLLKVPVKIICFGGVTPSRIVKNPSLKPKELVLFIPGNPGVIEFYSNFGRRLYEKTKIPLWMVAHGGHEDLPAPPLSKHPDLYNLQGQVRQKKELIDSYLSGVKLRCIGHSIGAKMVLDILKSGGTYTSQIETADLLFPTIENMASTVNGQRYIFGVRYFYWAAIILLNILNTFPTIVKKLIIYFLMICTRDPFINLPAFMRLLDARVVRKATYLGDDEMKLVLSRDDDVIKKCADRLRFFYSPKDGWTPPSYYEDLKAKFPEIKAIVDDNGITHSFSLKYSEITSEIVAGWLREPSKK